MNQCIVVGPTAYTVKPRFERVEFTICELSVEIFKQKDRGNLLFEIVSGKKFVGNLDEKAEVVLLQDFFPSPAHCTSKVGGVPTV